MGRLQPFIDRLPRDVKIVGVAGIIVVAGFLGALYLFAPGDAAGEPEMATSAIAGKSSGGRLLFGVDDVALGSTQMKDGAETTQWSGLLRAERRADLTPDTLVSLAAGEVAVDPINEARFTFRSAAYVKDGILHELVIPQNTLRIRIPGEPGHPGDTLVVTFDLGRSVADEAGMLYFRPYVSEAYWVQPPTPDETAAADPLAGNKSTDPVTPETQAYEASPAGGGDGGTATGRYSETQQAAVGHASFYVRDELAVAVDRLDVTFAKLGLSGTGDSADTIATYYEGGKRIDIRKYAGPEDRAHLVSFQLPAGAYSQIHLEFDAVDGRIGVRDETLAVPQPHMALEHNFTIEAGKTLEFLIDFSIPESVTPAGEGWEFRPVVAQLQSSEMDTDGDGIRDPRDPDDDNDGIPDNEDKDRDGDGIPDRKPPQYRTGGNPMPSVGQTNSYYVQTMTGRDPDATTEHAGNAATGGESRPVGSEGVQTITDPSELLKEPGIPIQTSNGQHLYILQSLSRNLLPSAQTLAPFGASEVARLDNLPVILVAGPPGIAPELRALPGVIHVEEDVAVAPFLDTARAVTRTDPVVTGQIATRAPDGSILTGKGVGIAIVDTGIDGTHPDLAYGSVVQRNMKLFYGGAVEMGDTDTTSGHGTAVAGIAAGRGYLREYTGSAPGATLYGLGAGEAFSVFWAMQAFDWILSNHDKVDPPIKVVVNSWGSSGTEYDARAPSSWYVSQLVDRGITVVFAAGNAGGDGKADQTTPECNHPKEGVVCVGAYDDRDRSTRDGAIASYSSRGVDSKASTWPDLVAPGTQISTTLALTGTTAATGVWQESPSLLYTTLSGSSMAAPMVGAAAAILYQLDPGMSPADVERALEQGAYSFDGTTRESTSTDARYAGSTFDRGHGLLDVQNAIDTWLSIRSTSTSGSTSDSGTTDSGDGSGGVVDDGQDLLEETGLV